MTTIVKRGTARRLGLRAADPLKHYRPRWVVPLDAGLEWATPDIFPGFWIRALDHGNEAGMTTPARCPMCSKPIESTVLAINAPDTYRHTDGTECAMFSRLPVTLAVEHALAPYLPAVPIIGEAP